MATGWIVVIDCSMVDIVRPGGMGTEGSAVLGIYVDGSMVTSGPGRLMLGLVSVELGSIGSRALDVEASGNVEISSGSREMLRRYSRR